MSVNLQAYEQYKHSVVETASPGRLLLMLYDAAIRNLDGAKRALSERGVQGTHHLLVKTQDIIMELMSTLNMDYDIAKNLFSLYEYLYSQLVKANVKKDAELVEEVHSFMLELRDTWQEAIKRAGTALNAANQITSVNVKG